MKQRDIIFVANEVNELGGVARWQAQMARLFAQRGHRVTIVGIAPPEKPMDLGDDVPFDTVTLYAERPQARWRARGLRGRANFAARRREAARKAAVNDAARKLSRLFGAARPGAVIVVTQVWAMEWVAAADTAGHPVIGMSHESFEYSKQSSRFQRVQRYYRDADRLLLLTQEDADLWVGKGLNNVGFMPNPLPFFPETPSPRSAKVVASIGRLDHQKGIDILLDTWAETAPEHPGWVLRIYGAGTLESELREQCTRLGLDGSVEWAGQTGDVQGALRGASVFVQSSRGEGFPLTLLEAMACGVPCAASDCAPGVREIIDDEVDGLLARPGNTMDLSRQLGRLLADAELRNTMGDRARDNVQRYSPKAITDRWESLFAFLER